MLIEAHFSTYLRCRPTAIFSENYCFTFIGYRQPSILQYIYHIKLATLRLCIKFQSRPPLQTIILLGYF